MKQPVRRRRRLSDLVIAGIASAIALPVSAQGPPPSPVRYTEAREHDVQLTITLPGSVESPTVSVVASELSGLVVKLHVREGDRVKQGAPIAQLRMKSLELRRKVSTAQLKEAKARLKLAELGLERARELFESKVTSQQQMDDAFFEFTAWEGRVEQLHAAIAEIDYDIERCTTRAPFDGVVIAEHAELGEWIEIGGPIIELVSLDHLEVRVEVPERYFHSLRRGIEARVSFESLGGASFDGMVDTIIPRADPQARSFPMKIALQGTNGTIGVGMLAQVTMTAGETHLATIVPKDAIVGDGPNQHVFLIDGNATIKQVPVETGEGAGDWIVVRGEIKAGQKIVTRGNERLFPGQPVEGTPLEYELP